MVYSSNLASPRDCIRQLNTAMSWYLWQGDTFRVPLSTLYRRKEHWGLTLIHAEVKCRALLLYRLQTLSQNAGTTTAQWLKKWNLLQPSKNPPNKERIVATLGYLRILETDSVYIVPQGKTETVRTYRRRIYDTIVIFMNTETKPPNMPIERLWPTIEWPRMWKNLWRAPVTDSTTTTW